MQSICWKINGVGTAESEDTGFSKGDRSSPGSLIVPHKALGAQACGGLGWDGYSVQSANLRGLSDNGLTFHNSVRSRFANYPGIAQHKSTARRLVSNRGPTN